MLHCFHKTDRMRTFVAEEPIYVETCCHCDTPREVQTFFKVVPEGHGPHAPPQLIRNSEPFPLADEECPGEEANSGS